MRFSCHVWGEHSLRQSTGTQKYLVSSAGLQRDIMIISDVLPVMVDDALLSSHPIIVNVSSPAEITSVFDAISYSKVQPLENPP